MLLMMFQWMSAPVHCCPANHNWTHEPTLNKKNQDSLVMLCLVKKQATRHLKLQLVFGRKHVCLLLATTLQVVFLYNIVSGIFGQNRLDNILTQWCPRMVDAALYRLFTLICQGPTLPKFPCAMLDQIDLDNFFMCRVVCGLWNNIAQVISCAMLAQADQDNIVA